MSFLATLITGIMIAVVSSWIDNFLILVSILPSSVIILFYTYAIMVIFVWRTGQQASRAEDTARITEEVIELDVINQQGENDDRDTTSTRGEPEVQDRMLTV